MDTNHPLGFVDLSNDQYHAAPGISKSHLDAIAGKSAKHYWEKYINPEREPEQTTLAKLIGSAMHTAILEPETMEMRVVVGLAHDRRSNAHKQAWAEYEVEHAGKIILKQEDYDHVCYVRDAVWRHPVAAGLLTGGRAEQSVFAKRAVPDGDGGVLHNPETGEVYEELVKCQFDYLRDAFDYAVDLKSTDDASKEGFQRSFAKYRYPVQTSWYQDTSDAAFGRHPKDWVFVCFEKEPPYAIGIYYPSEVSIARGRIAGDRDFRRIFEARRANYWPDYGETIQEIDLPPWSKL